MNTILAQIKEASDLASEGVKAVSTIDNPFAQILIVVLVLLIGFLVYAVIYFWKQSVKNFDNKEETIKKKDERLDQNQANLTALMEKNIETTIEFKQTVKDLDKTIRDIENNHNRDHQKLISELSSDREFYKKEINEIRELIKTI